MPDAPVVVLVATTLAAVLLLVEAALPTFGLAGASAFLLAIVVVVASAGNDQRWWPLLLVVAAVVVWAVALVTRAPTGTPVQIVAAALFAAGGITYGALAADAPTVALAAVAAAALPCAYPRLERATRRLNELAPQLGMDALIGRRGEVLRVDEARPTWGTVRLDGAFWNVHGDGPLEVGAPVQVVAFSGMTLEVVPTPTADR
jgi:membrane protein implicated in regulation of membrane protease activity